MDPVSAAVVVKLAVAAFQLIVIPVAVLAWRKWRKKIEDEDLRAAVDAAVNAAEQLNKSDKLKTSRQDYVWAFIDQKFPKLKGRRAEIEVLIEASVNAVNMKQKTSPA